MARGMSSKQDRMYDRVLKSKRDRDVGTRAQTEASVHEAKQKRARRGGLVGASGSIGPTYRELYAEATRRGLKGRSRMTKAQLERAIGRG